MPARNHSAFARTRPAGAGGASLGSSACSACTIASQAGAAPSTPDTLHIESPEKLPTHTPTVKRAREADAPVVAHVLAGAGLRGAPDARRERILEAEGGRAAGAIGEHVRHQERGLGREDALRPAPLARRLDVQRREATAARERAVRADHLPERHVGGAERERIAVELGVAQAVEAEAAEHGDEVVDTVTIWSSRTAGTFSDDASASRTATGPRKLRS